MAEHDFPSAFGVACDREAKQGSYVLTPLKGRYFASSRTFSVVKQVGTRNISYEGHLVWKENVGWSLQGRWKCDDQPELTGVFGCCRETNTPDLLSGLWIGKAIPDETLRFSVPANPITWSLTLSQTTSDGITAFGGGYFNDSGDVADTPVLCFSLRGEWKIDGSVKLVKHYENEAETDGYDVVYEGALSKEKDVFCLKGTWRNEKGHSFGTFGCRFCSHA